jgi:hypothetical protein
VGLSPEEVRNYHEVKVYFDGIIERGVPNETRIEVADLLPDVEGGDDAIALNAVGSVSGSKTGAPLAPKCRILKCGAGGL